MASTDAAQPERSAPLVAGAPLDGFDAPDDAGPPPPDSEDAVPFDSDPPVEALSAPASDRDASALGAGPSPDAAGASPDELSPEPALEAEPARAGAERASFFAQPLPLKTTAGVVRALRIDPPQTSQASGPVPWIEWTTSIERPQEVQRYS